MRRGKSEPRSAADDSVGKGKPEGGGVASAFSRVGVARVTMRAAADRLLVDLMMERVGVADEVDVEAIDAERLLLRAAAIVLFWSEA